MELKALRVSEKKAEVPHSMQIMWAKDLLTCYPFRYKHLEAKPRDTWEREDRIIFEAVIVNRTKVIRFREEQSVTRFKVMLEDEELSVSLFNRPWVSAFTMGKVVAIIGKYDGGSRVTTLQYNFKPMKEQLGIHPVYSVREGITQKELARYIDKAWQALQNQTPDVIPKPYLEKYRLIPRKQALYLIHHPSSMEAVKQSLRHLKYEGFLKSRPSIQALKTGDTEMVQGSAKQFSMEDVMDLKYSLGLSLTNDQSRVVEEILQDLSSDKVMYRVVRGDVSCGKTTVAASGLYARVLAHKQAVFMAPTEIPAKQHLTNLRRLFSDFDITADVLYSSLKPVQKKDVLERLKHNEIDILVGTYVLLQDDVEYYDLGMVVADEQHRFGAAQRKRMLEKGEKVNFLLMSATPVPRTLAISLYGDMDVSTIQELPKGRFMVTTKLISSRPMNPILEVVLEKINEGDQCYVVCPTIEKSEDMDMRNVTEVYDGMCASLGRQYRTVLLHGKMNMQEKDAVMERFPHGEVDILVSIMVIEVGMDVKAANIMVIYDAHRFGLSQVHQLRGRVGRGTRPGYCYLLSSMKDPGSLQRLKICEQARDGFVMTRADLRLRGPGDILGTRQSGVPGFILGDVIQDANILEVTREDTAETLAHLDAIGYGEIKMYAEHTVGSATYLDQWYNIQENKRRYQVVGTIFERLKNQNIAYSDKKLITQALVHPSYVNEHKSYAHDNERLEFMGDAVLQLWTAKKLFLLEPELSERQMTTLRARLVCEEALTKYNRQLGLGKCLMLGVGKEKTSGRQRDSILADMFEALLDAVFLDQDMEAIDSILSAVVIPAISRPKSEEVIDYKTKLQEYIQSNSHKTVHYETVNVPGPSNKPEFKVIVTLDDINLRRGKGFSRERTEQMTAKDAFEKMVR